MSSPSRPGLPPKVVVATTVALSFISFWRAAAIVLGDLASSSFYAGGIAEEAVGRADETSLEGLAAIIGWLYNEAPAACWGSEENVRDWLGKFEAKREAERIQLSIVKGIGPGPEDDMIALAKSFFVTPYLKP